MADFLSGAISAVTGLLGAGAAKGDMATSEEMITKNLQEIENLPLPDYQKMVMKYNLLKTGRAYTPEQEVAEQLKGNYYNNVKSDPEMIAKQREYLNYLDQIAKSGVDPQLMAEENALKRSLEAAQQSKMTDIQRDADMRGMGSSGANLLAKMTAQQQAQNTASAEADNALANMYARKMGAQGSLAEQAGKMDSTQFQRAMDLANQQQAIDKFNTAMRGDVQQRNVGGRNTSQQMNINRENLVSDKNTGTLNQQMQENADLERQRFNDQLAKYGRVAAARKDEAGMRTERAGRTAGEIAGAGTLLNTGLEAAGGLSGVGNWLSNTFGKKKPNTSDSGGQMGSGSSYGDNMMS